jgi:hypothetical protein
MLRAPFSDRLWLSAGGLMVAATLMAACAESRQPPVAAMVAQSANGDYGYSEERLAPDLFVVTYVSPRLRATRDADDSHGLAGEKLRVYDLALWRAAQLAVEHGYAAFRVQQESRDVDVTVRSEPIYPAYAPTPFLFARHCHWPCFWPYGYWPSYPYYDGGQRTRATGRVTVKLTVKMLPQSDDDAFDSKSTVDRLRKSYGSASFPLKTDY